MDYKSYLEFYKTKFLVNRRPLDERSANAHRAAPQKFCAFAELFAVRRFRRKNRKMILRTAKNRRFAEFKDFSINFSDFLRLRLRVLFTVRSSAVFKTAEWFCEDLRKISAVANGVLLTDSQNVLRLRCGAHSQSAHRGVWSIRCS